jgi:hypothetical protein
MIVGDAHSRPPFGNPGAMERLDARLIGEPVIARA